MNVEEPAELPVESTTNIQLLRCSECQQPVAPDSKFCSSCGAAIHEEGTGALPAVGDTGPTPAINAELFQDLEPGAAVLIVHRGPSEGERFPLADDKVSIGRAREATIFLDDVTVSRKHAQLERGSDGWRISDVGSLNGTYLNRERADDAPVANGDEIQVGKYRFIFLEVPGQ